MYHFLHRHPKEEQKVETEAHIVVDKSDYLKTLKILNMINSEVSVSKIKKYLNMKQYEQQILSLFN